MQHVGELLWPLDVSSPQRRASANAPKRAICTYVVVVAVDMSNANRVRV